MTSTYLIKIPQTLGVNTRYAFDSPSMSIHTKFMRLLEQRKREAIPLAPAENVLFIRSLTFPHPRSLTPPLEMEKNAKTLPLTPNHLQLSPCMQHIWTKFSSDQW